MKRQQRRVKSTFSCHCLGWTFWKTKLRYVIVFCSETRGQFACILTYLNWSHPSTVFALHLPSVYYLLLCCHPIFSQSLWLCGHASCSRHIPLLPVPKQEVCEWTYLHHFHCHWCCSWPTTSLQKVYKNIIIIILKCHYTHYTIWIIVIMILQSHVLVSAIGDIFQVSKKEENVRGGRDLIVEALRHKVSILL